MAQGIGDRERLATGVVGERRRLASRIGDRREVAGRIVGKLRRRRDRIGDRGDPVKRRLVGERPLRARRVGGARDVPLRIVGEPRHAPEWVRRRRGQIRPRRVLVHRRLPQRIGRREREALVVEAVNGGVAPRVGDRGLGQRGADDRVREGKDPTVCLGLANHAPLGVVLVGEIGDVARVGDARDPLARAIVAVARHPPGRVGDGRQAPLGVVGVLDSAADRVGDQRDVARVIVGKGHTAASRLRDAGNEAEPARARAGRLPRDGDGVAVAVGDRREASGVCEADDPVVAVDGAVLVTDLEVELAGELGHHGPEQDGLS